MNFESLYPYAPGLLSGQPFCAAVEIWDLGVILYEMCAFQYPFNLEVNIKHNKGMMTPQGLAGVVMT